MPRVADAVHVLPFEMETEQGVRRFNPAAVETDSGVVLLDVGFPHTLDQIEAGLDEAGYGFEDVELVLLTHHDGDHAAGLAALLERTDALVAAHREEAPFVDGREEPIKTPDDQERYEPVTVDVELVGGEAINTAAGPMELIYTPGHCPGHLSAYLPEQKLLITADAMTADEDGIAGPAEQFTLDMETALDSIGDLSDLDVDSAICFHGGPVEATDEDIADVHASLSD